MLIAEDLLLLLYDGQSGKPITSSPGLEYALAGAVLAELTMLGKVDIAGAGESVRRGGLKVLDATRTRDPLLDDRLAILVARAGWKPASVIGALSRNLRVDLLARLAERGILEVDRRKVLGLFPVTCWPARDPRHEADIRRSLNTMLNLGTQPDDRAAALVALLQAISAVPKVVSSVDKKAVKRRVKAISETVWAADAVRRAVQAATAQAGSSDFASPNSASLDGGS